MLGQLRGTRFEVLNCHGLSLILHLDVAFFGQSKTHAGHCQIGHLRCSLTDACKVFTFQHDLGASLPAFDFSVTAVARIHAKAATVHLHVLALCLRLEATHGGVHTLLQLLLHCCGISALAVHAQVHLQPVLIDLYLPRRRKLHHIAQRLGGLRMGHT